MRNISSLSSCLTLSLVNPIELHRTYEHITNYVVISSDKLCAQTVKQTLIYSLKLQYYKEQ